MKSPEGKYKKLLLSLLLDGIGMLSLLIPGLGPVLDLIWAPLAGWLMTRMYPGRFGTAAAFITFVEELLPGTDVVPTFTLMWIYTFYASRLFKKDVDENKPPGTSAGQY